MSILGSGNPQQFLTENQVEAIVTQGLDSLSLAGKRVLVIIPDGTRTMPMPLFFRLITQQLMGKARQLDFMVALGTHPPMSEQGLLQLVGISAEEKASRYSAVNLINHAWKDAAALMILGTIPGEEILALSGGLLEMEVPVRLNRRILDYDELLICGPVFPHEVVGFSGREQILLPRDCRQRYHRFYPLVGRSDHLLQNHRHKGHAHAASDQPGRRDDPGAAPCLLQCRHAMREYRASSLARQKKPFHPLLTFQHRCTFVG